MEISRSQCVDNVEYFFEAFVGKILLDKYRANRVAPPERHRPLDICLSFDILKLGVFMVFGFVLVMRANSVHALLFALLSVGFAVKSAATEAQRQRLTQLKASLSSCKVVDENFAKLLHEHDDLSNYIKAVDMSSQERFKVIERTLSRSDRYSDLWEMLTKFILQFANIEDILSTKGAEEQDQIIRTTILGRLPELVLEARKELLQTMTITKMGTPEAWLPEMGYGLLLLVNQSKGNVIWYSENILGDLGKTPWSLPGVAVPKGWGEVFLRPIKSIKEAIRDTVDSRCYDSSNAYFANRKAQEDIDKVYLVFLRNFEYLCNQMCDYIITNSTLVDTDPEEVGFMDAYENLFDLAPDLTMNDNGKKLLEALKDYRRKQYAADPYLRPAVSRLSKFQQGMDSIVRDSEQAFNKIYNSNGCFGAVNAEEEEEEELELEFEIVGGTDEDEIDLMFENTNKGKQDLFDHEVVGEEGGNRSQLTVLVEDERVEESATIPEGLERRETVGEREEDQNETDRTFDNENKNIIVNSHEQRMVAVGDDAPESNNDNDEEKDEHE